MVRQYNVDLIAIGNAVPLHAKPTAFVADVIKRGNLKAQRSLSAEAGASVVTQHLN